MKRDHGSPEATQQELCSDCPPLGYPTNKTRCAECPNRSKRLAHCDLCGKDVPGNMKGEVYKHKCMHRAAEQASGGRDDLDMTPSSEDWWDQNSVQCGNCSVEIVARNSSVPGNHNALSHEEGEEESLCGYCAGEELHRLLDERHDMQTRLADMMIKHSITTGHGDSMQDLLSALSSGLVTLRSDLTEALYARDAANNETDIACTQLAETRGIAGELAAALKAYMFVEQTRGGVNPHASGTNRHRAFELGRAAIARARAAGISPEKGKT